MDVVEHVLYSIATSAKQYQSCVTFSRPCPVLPCAHLVGHRAHLVRLAHPLGEFSC